MHVRGYDNSPTELLFNRHISTSLPSVYDTYQPHVDLLERNGKIAKYYHDTSTTRPRPLLAEDSNVIYRDPITRKRKLVIITLGGTQPRSYNLGTPYATYIRRYLVTSAPYLPIYNCVHNTFLPRNSPTRPLYYDVPHVFDILPTVLLFALEF